VPRFISYTVTLIAFIALCSAGGYVLSRWYEWDPGAIVSMYALKWSLYIVVGCCAYAGLVGIYHTILSITGLDEEREEPKT
jgi:hypothetical protein